VSRGRYRLAVLTMASLALTLAGGTAALASTPTVPAPSTAPTPSSSTGSGGPGSTPGSTSTLAIAVTSLTPSVVTPTSTLTIKGTVTNAGRTTVQNGIVRLDVHHSPLVSRALVADWGAGDIDDVGGRILDANADLTIDLAPGLSTSFTIKAPAQLLGLRMDYASIGITIEAIGDDGTDFGTRRLGLLRTYLTWQENPTYLPLRVTWLMPLTDGPGSATGGPPSAAALAAALAPHGRLANELAAIRSGPAGAALSVAIDPALVADLESRSRAPSGSTPTSTASGPTSTSGTATPGADGSVPPSSTVADYLTQLKAAVTGRRIVQLPYGDPDLMGTADNNGSSLVTAAVTAAGTGPTSILGKEFGVAPVTSFGWPAGGWADDTTVSAARKAGASNLVLAAASRPPRIPQTTPSALAPLSTASGGSSGSTAVLYDDVLSSLLAHTNNAATSVLTVQRFLAETLAIVGERPGRSRILLVAAPRNFNPDPAVAQQLFSAVGSAPWLRPATLSQLRSGAGQDEVTDRTEAPIPTSVTRAQITAGQVTAVRDVRAQAAQLSEVIVGDNPLTQTRVDALRLVSTGLRGHAGTAAARTKALKASLSTIGAKVRILPLSTLNFLASDGNLTLSVANDLPEDVHNLRVEVQPGNGRLVVVKQAGPITVDAQRRTTIKVHVHAVAGGVVPVTARILTPSGLAMGRSVTVQVHVRPTDTWAFWVLGVAAGLVFVVGLWRTIRRGRSRPRLQAPEVDPL
jgi:hypothetical protein